MIDRWAVALLAAVIEPDVRAWSGGRGHELLLVGPGVLCC